MCPATEAFPKTRDIAANARSYEPNMHEPLSSREAHTAQRSMGVGARCPIFAVVFGEESD